MRRFALTIGVVLVVVASVAIATAWATATTRTDDALDRLEDGAARLQECHAARRTYDGCESGEERVDNHVRDTSFTLSTEVFGIGRLSISATDGGALQRTCEGPGARCSDERWRAPRD